MGFFRTKPAAAISMMALTLLFTACGDDTTTAATGGTSAPAGGTVDVTLQEFAIAVVPGTVSAGEVTFEVTNDGPDDVHEFVIIRTDIGMLDLPVDADGAVDEAGGDMEVVDEIEDIAVGDTASVTATLDAGAYVLICNLVEEEEDGTIEAHYSEGMRTGFTVT
jgi:uncharacterized cupredoxin-like copper-binding protein